MKEETKENTKAFFDKVKRTFDRGIRASKKALGVAGDAVQDFGDKSVLRIEKMQLETKQKKQFEMLGEYIYKNFSSKNSSIKSGDEKIAVFIKEIKRLDEEIKIREEGLKEGTPAKKSVSVPEKSETKKAVKNQTSDVKIVSKKTAPAKKTAAKKTAVKAASKSTGRTAKKTVSKK